MSLHSSEERYAVDAMPLFFAMPPLRQRLRYDIDRLMSLICCLALHATRLMPLDAASRCLLLRQMLTLRCCFAPPAPSIDVDFSPYTTPIRRH